MLCGLYLAACQTVFRRSASMDWDPHGADFYVAMNGSDEWSGRIGWVDLSQTTRSYSYARKRFLKTKSGYKHNCIEVETRTEYWISGPKKRGGDKLCCGVVDVRGCAG